MPTSNQNKKFGKTIINDFKSGELKKGFLTDMKELYYFYISDKDREKLNQKGYFVRWIIMVWWMLKLMFFKLTSVRRIMILIGLFLSITKFEIDSGNFRGEFNGIGLLLIFIVLMLELKDKLLAKDELEVGRKVQRALLPKENPELSGWEFFLYTRPANEVGGDLVDYIQIDENRLGIILADVAGKGLGAALFMSKLQATIRAIISFYKSLTELGEQVNKIFRRDGLPNKFASLIVAELQQNSGEIKLLNAGHFPPYLISKNKIEELEKGGPGIGLMDSAIYEEKKYNLEKGDCLFIYSDGITEAKNKNDEFFGDDKLKNIVSHFPNLPVNKAAEKILSEVAAFVGQTRQSDDLSFVIIKKC